MFDFSLLCIIQVSFGTTTLNIPIGTQNYSQRLDLRTTKGIYVDVNAGLDKTTGIVTWTFTAIDPTTGNPTTTQGFLPPNDSNGAGSGYVGYSIQSKANGTNATRIDAQASITFNNGTPIQTNNVFNTLDSNEPTSQVTALPASSNNPNFTVAWTSFDNGSGIASYNIYASVDNGAFSLWKDNITDTSAIYNGQVGRSYKFYSTATDNVGNQETPPFLPDASTQIVGTKSWNLDIDGDGKIGALSDGIITVRYLFGSAFSSNALINGAISPTATRNLSQIQAYLQEGVTNKYLDIDGNGSVGALSDGIMAVRYMFGSAFSGNALIDGAIAPDATRDLAGVQSYLSGLTTLP